jgi:MSHA pilin protein MshA
VASFRNLFTEGQTTQFFRVFPWDIGEGSRHGNFVHPFGGKKMKRQSGFTLIELVMVIVILGILAASFAPRFVDLSSSATAAAKAGASGAVKSGLTVAIADLKTSPSVTQLATYVQGDGVAAAATGIDVTVDGATVTVPTYTDAGCSSATAAVGNVVRCVGDAP